nr:MAG TPA: hypothetical protein [Caudoviricetes sp.]
MFKYTHRSSKRTDEQVSGNNIAAGKSNKRLQAGGKPKRQ